MTTKLHSVLVEVDEAANVMRLWRQFIGDVPSPFRLLELPLDRLPVDKHSAVVAVIGEAVLGGLADAHASLAVYRSDQAGMDSPDLQGAIAKILLQAVAGDPEAQNAYGTMLCDRSLNRLDPAYLEEAEEWFRKAAASGQEEAVRSFESWPKQKQYITTEIAKRRSDGNSKPPAQ
ncbi:sel1 repeat family protein [Variovorax sp. MHTC-1]|uniref:sel1 repeat family protein n=1 Tax=Variovorax sp. MHTC-1 TaxID=2495593 RepID=UPI000F85CFA3|nr:sel1 repeat family protein [Variovorax sp. MHTC-1]RST49420.1 sel1 repeat family protein [Variovorax sp. MHTC-1]